jgi:hypothetical protein
MQATAPFIVELAIPLPMEIFTGFAVLALFTSFFIKKSED